MGKVVKVVTAFLRDVEKEVEIRLKTLNRSRNRKHDAEDDHGEKRSSSVSQGMRTGPGGTTSPGIALNGLRSGASPCGTAPSKPRIIQFNVGTR